MNLDHLHNTSKLQATIVPPQASPCPNLINKMSFRTALTPKEVTERYPELTESEGVLANWRNQKIGPKYYKLNRKVIYRPEDIEDYMFASPVLTTDSVK